MSSELFRREVLDAKRAGWLGAICIVQPVRFWVLAAGAAALALAVVLVLAFGTYTRRSRVTGQLVPVNGLAVVVAPTSGLISQIRVAEGDEVDAGQILAVLSVPRATTVDGDTAAALASRLERRAAGLKAAQDAREHRSVVRRRGLSRQLASARVELQQIEAEIHTRQQQVSIAQETFERMRRLEEQRFVSAVEVKQQVSAVLALTAELQSLRRQAVSTRRLITQLGQTVGELPAEERAAHADYQRDVALLEQERVENAARSEIAVIAASSGVVSLQQVKAGQAVRAGQALMSVLPGDGTLEAELLVPSRAIGFIEPGDKVLLRYQAYPYQKFGHHAAAVSKISRSTIAQTDGLKANEPLYRITVALDNQVIQAYGKPEPLKPGMLVEADILGETRSIFEWAFEPIYSVKGSVFGR